MKTNHLYTYPASSWHKRMELSRDIKMVG